MKRTSAGTRPERVLLIGANGQLGTDLVAALEGRVGLVGVTHRELEITDAASVESALVTHRPDLVVNTAAFNRVDDCEREMDTALRVNALGPHLLARACSKAGAALMHISTDYVFSVPRDSPWSEMDCPSPASAYGISKLAGEHAVQAACERSYVIRTSGLYGLTGSAGKGGNFVETMLRLQVAGQSIRVVDDQVLGPTPTRDLADKLSELILQPAPYGLYHVTSAGACSWYELARALFELAGLPVDLAPRPTDPLDGRATRPSYSVLANERLREIGLEQIRHWREGLAGYLRDRSAHSQPAPSG